MPVIILVGDDAKEYISKINNQFQSKYNVEIPQGKFVDIRSMLANMKKDTLYILSGLTKPERYEIFCLARKNEENFLSVAKTSNDLIPSDKNQLVMSSYDGSVLDNEMNNSKIAVTQANKGSKGFTLKGVRDIKKIIKQLNEDLYIRDGETMEILKRCEEKLIKLVSKGLGGDLSKEEIEKCYCQMVKIEMEVKKNVSKKK